VFPSIGRREKIRKASWSNSNHVSQDSKTERVDKGKEKKRSVFYLRKWRTHSTRGEPPLRSRGKEGQGDPREDIHLSLLENGR